MGYPFNIVQECCPQRCGAGLAKGKHAVGQIVRNQKANIEPLSLLAVAVIAQAFKDAQAVTSPKGHRKFQPGLYTPDKILKKEKRALERWLQSDNYVLWARACGMSWDNVDNRRKAMQEVLGSGRRSS